MDDINKKIKNIVDSNNIVLFMKGTPESPQCGFSMAVSNILKHLKVKFEGINVLENDEIRQGIKIIRIGQRYLNYISRVSLLVVAIL